MDYKIITKTSSGFVSVAELKMQLMLWGDDSYDAELVHILESAVDLVSDYCGKSLTIDTILRPLASFDSLTLLHDNISDLTVAYYNGSGDLVTMADTDYILDITAATPRLTFKNKPALSSDLTYPISINYTSTPTVPARIKHAVLVAATELFEVRGETTEKARAKATMTIDRLIGSFKRVEV